MMKNIFYFLSQNLSLGFGLMTELIAFFTKSGFPFFLPRIISNPAAVYPNGPVTNIKSLFFEFFLETILSTIPKRHTLNTISLPPFVSPPKIEILNSLDAFLNPETIWLIFEREIVFGKIY